MLSKSEILQWLEKSQRDPLLFSEKILGDEKPWSKQIEIMEAVRDYPRVSVRSGQGVGKTWTAGRIALWFLYSFPYSIVITTAPTFRQVSEILWSEIRRQYGKSKVPLGGIPLQTRIGIDDGWFALGLSTDYPDTFQGFHAENILAVIDEASGVDRPIWDAVESILTTKNAHCLAIGNAIDSASYFGETHKPNSGWHRIKISCLESPNVTSGEILYPKLVTRAWVEDKRKIWGEGSALWMARVEGEFPEEGTNTVIPLRYIDMATEREMPHEGKIEIGVDVARYGDDRTILAARMGNGLIRMEQYQKENTMETTGRTIAFGKSLNGIDPKSIPMKVDVIGVGAGVVDRLSEQGYNVIPVNSAEKSRDAEKYKNLRAEMWFSLRDRFIEGTIALPKDEELMGELAGVKYKIDSQGRLQIEEKEEVKKRLGRSPDKADALVYCFAPLEDRGPRLRWLG